MLAFIFFCVLIIILFFVSQALTKSLYYFFYLFLKNESKTIQLLTWLLLPGTVVHEVSHMLLAELLGIRTGEFSFVPEIIEENKIKAGSIKMVKADPIRQAIIGLGPVIMGLLIIFSINRFLFLPIVNNNLEFLSPITHYSLLIICIYFLFTISITMFSSSKDLETVFFPLILILLISGALWLANISLELPSSIISFFNNLLINLNWGLGLGLGVDFFLLIIIKLLVKLKRR